MEELTEQEICKKLKKLYDESEGKVKTEAMIRRAYIDKTSKDTIDEKVNAQMNAIRAGIYNINPKFKEGSKNYESTKQLVLETLSNYEQALIELGKFYDGKIEQLILRKVELEASLVGAILNEEYLDRKVVMRSEQKDNDKVKRSVKDNIKSTLEKIMNKKKNNTQVNPIDISKVLDQQDVVIEIDQKLSNVVEKTAIDKNENSEFIEKVEKEIAMISDEIDRINDRKKKTMYDAMEVGNKAIATNIRKPRVFSKITRFFASKFNTARVIETTIIDPLNLRIESFKNNELIDMKG